MPSLLFLHGKLSREVQIRRFSVLKNRKWAEPKVMSLKNFDVYRHVYRFFGFCWR